MSIHRALVAGEVVEAPLPIAQSTPLPSRPRGERRPTQVIVHESVTASTERTVRVLQRRGLGVHLIVGPGGEVTQHGDLITDRMAHAGSQNGTSIAIEVVNPYYGSRLREPWSEVIQARWAHRGQYIVPTEPQLEATTALLRWATAIDGPVRVPRVWVGLVEGQIALSRLPREGLDVRAPGIWAHTYTAHADGAFPVLYSWLRIERGLSACDAYAEAIRYASDGGEGAHRLAS